MTANITLNVPQTARELFLASADDFITAVRQAAEGYEQVLIATLGEEWRDVVASMTLEQFKDFNSKIEEEIRFICRAKGKYGVQVIRSAQRQLYFGAEPGIALKGKTDDVVAVLRKAKEIADTSGGDVKEHQAIAWQKLKQEKKLAKARREEEERERQNASEALSFTFRKKEDGEKLITYLSAFEAGAQAYLAKYNAHVKVDVSPGTVRQAEVRVEDITAVEASSWGDLTATNAAFGRGASRKTRKCARSTK